MPFLEEVYLTRGVGILTYITLCDSAPGHPNGLALGGTRALGHERSSKRFKTVKDN